METKIIRSTVTSIACNTACGQGWGGTGETRKYSETGVFECFQAAPSVTGAPAPLVKCGIAHRRGLNPARFAKQHSQTESGFKIK